MLTKTAKLTVIKSYLGAGGFRKAAAASDGFTATETKLSSILNEFSDMYKISSNPADYIFCVARAVTADVPNENADCFGEYELLRMNPKGAFVYETFNGVPLLEEHRDEDLTTAGGIIVDAYYDDTDPSDRKVMALIAVDMVKERRFASKLLSGAIQGFSMGCSCERSRCSICDHVASVPEQYCSHIANKFQVRAHGGKPVFEWCEGVTYRELSRVAQPADTSALSVEVVT